MPIYEFKCIKCDNEFETLVYGNNRIDCPQCKSSDIKKLLSTFSKHGGDKPSSGSNSCGSCSSSGHKCSTCH